MQEKNELSKEQLSALIGIVAKKMGKSPEKLTQELKSGTIPDERVRGLLGNKDELQAMLDSPQIKELLRALKDKK